MGNYCQITAQRVRLESEMAALLTLKFSYLAEERISGEYYGHEPKDEFVERVLGWKTLDEAADHFGFSLRRTRGGFLLLDSVFWEKADKARAERGEKNIYLSSDRSFKHWSDTFFLALMTHATADSFIRVKSITYGGKYYYYAGQRFDADALRAYYAKLAPWNTVKVTAIEVASDGAYVVSN